MRKPSAVLLLALTVGLWGAPISSGQTSDPLKQEVDELYDRWRKAGAKVLAEPEDKPWNLREFRVADLDGNQLRVFYDFAWELRQAQA